MQGRVWLVAAPPGKGQIWGSLMVHFWFEYKYGRAAAGVMRCMGGGKFHVLSYLACRLLPPSFQGCPGMLASFWVLGTVLAFLIDQQVGILPFPSILHPRLFPPPPPVFTQQDLFMLTLFKFADGGRKKDRVE